MQEETIVDEAHRVRREISAQFNDDVHAFFEYLRRREAEHPDRIVTFEPVTPEPVATDKPGGMQRS